jgi:GntR family transcriptional regulator, rspAB operon transcriptional repressor
MFPSWEDDTSKSAIYVELRRSILMGYRKPGERFDVEAIAQQYNASITPVRDALQMLSQEGLVNIKPRSGYFVARTTLKQLRDLLDIRHILELASIERAVEKISPEQVAELRAVHAGYTGDDDVSYDRYTDENRRFHYLLAKASGNNELTQLMGRLHDRLAPFMVMRHGGRTQVETHKRIIDALEAHDLDTARDALLDDIEKSHESILDKVLQKEAETWHVG